MLNDRQYGCSVAQGLAEWETKLDQTESRLARECNIPTRKPCDIIPVCRSQSRKVETLVLMWVVTEGLNAERNFPAVLYVY